VVAPLEKQAAAARDASDTVFVASRSISPAVAGPLLPDGVNGAASVRFVQTNGAIAQVAVGLPDALLLTGQPASDVAILSYERCLATAPGAPRTAMAYCGCLGTETAAHWAGTLGGGWCVGAGAAPEPWTPEAAHQQTQRYRKRPSRSLYLVKSGLLVTVVQDEVGALDGGAVGGADQS